MFTVPTTDVLIQGIISGLLMGCIYALIAAGLSLIFGLMEIVNFAHGEFLMLAMYTAFWMYTLFALDPLLSVPICGGVLFVLVYAQGDHPADSRRSHARADLRHLRPGDLPPCHGPVPVDAGFSPGVRAAGSGTGEALRHLCRACATGSRPGFPAGLRPSHLVHHQDRGGGGAGGDGAGPPGGILHGINTERMFTLGWGISSACVGVAGAFLASFFYVFPYVGSLFGLLAFVTVALGGFGSIPGSLVAGIMIGVIEVMAGLLIAPAFKYVAVFAIYLIVVLIRPQGLFGKF
jgi:branched-chain amino acid transport system permease protein